MDPRGPLVYISLGWQVFLFLFITDSESPLRCELAVRWATADIACGRWVRHTYRGVFLGVQFSGDAKNYCVLQAVVAWKRSLHGAMGGRKVISTACLRASGVDLYRATYLSEMDILYPFPAPLLGGSRALKLHVSGRGYTRRGYGEGGSVFHCASRLLRSCLCV